MANVWSKLSFLGMPVLLFGCETEGQFDDLDAQMGDLRQNAEAAVESLPVVPQIESLNYTAAAMRSPFAPLLIASEKKQLSSAVVQTPDHSRPREPLESFNFSALSMVGTLSYGQQIWAVINDGEDGIHRVARGNYIGKNYGEITQIDDTQIQVVETVPDDSGAWVYRTRLLLATED
jgi:type IV pilus assembly protein PilP